MKEVSNIKNNNNIKIELKAEKKEENEQNVENIENKKNEENNENKEEIKQNEEKEIKEENNDNINNKENENIDMEPINKNLNSDRKITNEEVKECSTLILESKETDIFNGQTININASGMIGGRDMDNNPNEELNTQPEVPEITTGESNEPVINTEPQPVVEPTPVVESTPVPVQPVENPAEEPKKKGHGLVFALIALILVIVIGVVIGLKVMNKKEEPVKEKETKKEIPASPYQISGYDIGAFDLYFLQLENTKKNKVYSPLSIKYTLTMLNEGTDGDSHDQIKSVVGDYSAKKYTNNNNMSFANALFVKNSYKDGIKKEYVETLKTKYDAEVGYDSFATPTVVNSWISNKTFKLINNMLDDISNQDFILVNALAIDMQWVHQIDTDGNRKDDKFKSYIWTEYTHRDFQKTFLDLQNTDYTELKFEGVNYKVQAVPIAAVANKYDVIATVGEDNIRKTVTAEYKKWLDAGAEGSCVNAEVGEKDPAPEVYIETYMKELGEHYKDLQYTTDFLFYVNDDVKVFAKDLKIIKF